MTPELSEYLQDAQDAATVLTGLLKGLDVLMDAVDNGRPEACAIRSIHTIAVQRAEALTEALDSLNLPDIDPLQSVSDKAA